jgi:hypothetical protein
MTQNKEIFKQGLELQIHKLMEEYGYCLETFVVDKGNIGGQQDYHQIGIVQDKLMKVV